MIRNYITTALRNLRKGRIYSFINLAGLSIGTAVFILLALFVRDEWTFDKFHQNTDRIYRAWVKEHYQGELFFNTVTPYILGQELRDNFPEIEQVARYTTMSSQVKKGNFSEAELVHVVEPQFLKVFDFPLIRGKIDQALDGVHQVVITEEMGQKYFGDPYPIGQTMTIQMGGEWTEFKVSGVIEKAPSNSSIQYSLLIPFENTKTFMSEQGRASWTNVNVETYLMLNESISSKEMAAKVAPFVDEKVAKSYKPGEYIVGFQPLTDIHLNNDYPLGFVQVSDSRYPYILGGVALLILALACINFTTLAVGRSVTRAKEVGVRKATGATRQQLMMQFWSEAIVTAGIAVVIGILIAEAALPFFNSLADKQLAIAFSPQMVMAGLGLILLTGLLSGLYPALVLSGFSPIQTLRGAISKMGNDKHVVLRGLVGFQFVLSILLIICTMVMVQQMRFLQNKNLGYDQDQVVVVPYNRSGVGLIQLAEEGQQVTDRLRNELSGKPGFMDVARSVHQFGTAGWLSIGYTEEATDQFRSFFLNGMDGHFLGLMDIQLKAGRPFSKEMGADSNAVVINEAYAQAFGLENPVGQPLQKPFESFTVIGMAPDFNFESLHNEVQPLCMAIDPVGLLQIASDASSEDGLNPKISVKISGENIPAALSTLRLAWQKVAPEQPFSYTFLDENIGRQYQAESRLSQIISIATGLAIFIACLGLFGIATLTIAQRLKEIGVRKVLGASTGDIVFLLNKNFTVMVLIATVVALPLAWYAMSSWLDDFAYRISVSPWMMGLGGVVALLLTWVTVGWQTFRAAMGNPVKSLRSE